MILECAGVGISGSLFQLGIPVGTADDLTPSDIAKLLRYVRINKLEAIKSAASLLGELIVLDDEAEKCAPSHIEGPHRLLRGADNHENTYCLRWFELC